jgi:hypothetical protein
MSNTGWVIEWAWRNWTVGVVFGPEVWCLRLGPLLVGFDPEMWKFTRIARDGGVS